MVSDREGIIIVSGFIDDLRGLGLRTKFLAQIAAALFVVYPGMVRIENLGNLFPDGVILPEWVSIPLTLVTIVGVTNAINLSDGLEGLAGGTSLLIFCCTRMTVKGNEKISGGYGQFCGRAHGGGKRSKFILQACGNMGSLLKD